MTRTARLRGEGLEDRATPSSGDLDPTFGGGGRVQVSGLQQVTTLLDDSFLALTQNKLAVAVSRFLPDGTPDASFAVTPIDYPNGGPVAFAALPDGGALVGWGQYETPLNKSVLNIFRLTSAGTRDASFGTNGAVTLVAEGGQYAAVSVLAVQPDGRLLVTADQNDANGPSHIYMTRLLSNGQPDPTFGTGGVQTVNFPLFAFDSVFSHAAAVAPDGRIVIAGEVLSAAGASVGSSFTPMAVRLTADGQLDSTFGIGGRVTVPYPSQNTGSFTSAAVLADGSVMVGGYATIPRTGGGSITKAALAKLTPVGQLDAGYGSGGVAVSQSVGTPSVPTFDATGRAVYTVQYATYDRAYGPRSYGYLERLTPAGVGDTTFGVNGVVDTNRLLNYPLNSSNPPLPAVTLQSNGNILVGGAWGLARVVGSAPAGFVGSGAGVVLAGGEANGTVRVLTPTDGVYAVSGTMAAYAGFGGSVRSAVADVNGDGTPDYITAAGPGGAPAVTVFDGKTGNAVLNFLAFEPSFAGGLFVTAADLDGDGRAEVVATPDQGGGGRVVVYGLAPGGGAVARASFFGIDDPNFRGGARVAAGDFNNDDTPDLVVTAGFLGGPRAAIFNGKSILTGNPFRLISDFFAFPGTDAETLRNGVFVTAGDVDGDGFAELVFGGGPGGAPRVLALSGAKVSNGDVAGAQASPVSNFFVAGNADDRGGVRLTTTDADGDGKADVVVGSGEGSPSKVRIYLGKNFIGAGEPSAFQDLDPFGTTLSGGVFVG